MTAPGGFSRGGWRGLVGVGLLGDDLCGQLDALVADRDVGGWAAHDRGDLVACLSAERAADLAKRPRRPRRLGGHPRNAIGLVVRR
jgi:hypothetical protein